MKKFLMLIAVILVISCTPLGVIAESNTNLNVKADQPSYTDLSKKGNVSFEQSKIKTSKNFRLETSKTAKGIEKVYTLKKSDLPVKLGDIVITGFKVDFIDKTSSLFINGYLSKDAQKPISSNNWEVAYIDKNNIYRLREPFVTDLQNTPLYKQKFPHIKSCLDFTNGFVDETETVFGEEFTYPVVIASPNDEVDGIKGDWCKFKTNSIEKIVIYNWDKGSEMIVFDKDIIQ